MFIKRTVYSGVGMDGDRLKGLAEGEPVPHLELEPGGRAIPAGQLRSCRASVVSFCSVLHFIRLQLIYNVVFVSGIQQSGSCVYIYIYIFFHFFRFFSHVGYNKILSRIPCAIQEVLVGYPFKIQQCVHVYIKLPNCPFLSASISLFSTSVSLFLFCK